MNVLDIEATRMRLAYDDDLLRDLVQFFFEDGAQLLNEIRAGIAGEQWSDVERSAHSLKGLAANFGAKPAVEAARRLEAAARAENAADIVTQQAEVEQQTARLMIVLREWCARTGTGATVTPAGH